MSPDAKALFASPRDWKKQGYFHDVALTAHSSLQWWAQLYEQLLHLHITRPMCVSRFMSVLWKRGRKSRVVVMRTVNWAFYLLFFSLGSGKDHQWKYDGESYRTLWKGLLFISQGQPGQLCSWKKTANKMDFPGWLYVNCKSQTEYQAVA